MSPTLTKELRGSALRIHKKVMSYQSFTKIAKGKYYMDDLDKLTLRKCGKL